MKKALVLISAFALVAVACTDRSRTDNTTSNNTAVPADNSGNIGSTTQEPGSIGTSNTDKGSAEVKRDVIRRETKEENVPTVEEKMVKADINRMDDDDFVALGMPRNVAESIVKFREKNGKFNSLEELRRVPGFDSAWLEKNRSKLGISTG